MLQFYQNVAARIPIRMLTTGGVPVPLLTYLQVAATIEKSDGTASSVTMSSGTWSEITFGDFNLQGKYDLIVPSSFTNLLGPLSVAVSSTGADTFVGEFEVIANIDRFLMRAFNTTAPGTVGYVYWEVQGT